MMKLLLIACLLSVALDSLFVQCQWPRYGGGGGYGRFNIPTDIKLPQPSQNQFSSSVFHNSIFPNNEKFKTNQEMNKWSSSGSFYGNNLGKLNGNAQFDRNDFNMFGLSLDNGRPRISNLGYGHEFSNGVRVHGGVDLSQDRFLGRPVGGNIGIRIPFKRDLERQIQLEQEQQEIDEAEFKNDVTLSEQNN